MDEESTNPMKKQSNGTEKQQIKVMQRRNLNLDGCTKKGKAGLNLMKKQLNGCMNMGKAYLNQMKKLSNGSEKPQSKEMKTHEITLG
uniref:Ovule protein n=1 Tax=Plectus sambesii TaxID=2011161 RepID=A0A914XBZ4_9BILA